MADELAGRHVVVTRPAGQAAHLAEALINLGARPVLFPVLTIFDIDDPRPLQEAALKLDDVDWAAFVSPNAVEKALGAILALRPWPSGLRAATVGKSSEQAVAARHIRFNTSKVRYFRKWHGRAVANVLRGWLLSQYVWQIGLEAIKYALGQKRDLRRQRIGVYGQVLRSRLR